MLISSSFSVHPLPSISSSLLIMLRILSDRKYMLTTWVEMNIRILVDPVGILFDQPFRPAAIRVTPDMVVFSSGRQPAESEQVKPIFEILDAPLQIGVVNIGQSRETWTRNFNKLALGNKDRQLFRTNTTVTNGLSVSDVGNKVCTTRESRVEVCNHGVGTFERNGNLKYN